MKLESPATAGSKIMFIIGWILSGLVILMMGILPIIMGLLKFDMVRDGAVDKGYKPHHAAIILVLEIVCGLTYAIPQTAVLGAILLTGYLGGAVATHVRIDDPGWPGAVIFGIVAWLGLFLRDARLRALVPLRRAS